MSMEELLARAANDLTDEEPDLPTLGKLLEQVWGEAAEAEELGGVPNGILSALGQHTLMDGTAEDRWEVTHVCELMDTLIAFGIAWDSGHEIVLYGFPNGQGMSVLYHGGADAASGCSYFHFVSTGDGPN